MTHKITWEQLEPLLSMLNASEIERKTGIRERKISDVKAGKSTLTIDELEAITNLIESNFPQKRRLEKVAYIKLSAVDSLEVTIEGDSLHYALIDDEGLHPINAESIEQAVAQTVPSYSKSQQLVQVAKIIDKITPILTQHEKRENAAI